MTIKMVTRYGGMVVLSVVVELVTCGDVPDPALNGSTPSMS